MYVTCTYKQHVRDYVTCTFHISTTLAKNKCSVYIAHCTSASGDSIQSLSTSIFIRTVSTIILSVRILSRIFMHLLGSCLFSNWGFVINNNEEDFKNTYPDFSPDIYPATFFFPNLCVACCCAVFCTKQNCKICKKWKN